ncbi:hypothetical protein Slin15195_G040910 [Septoria linicola]|uniref:F-box domain-containing protein n=1 Tax=Septoria linicola TaxID=215465 RepID=A0A9Q9ARK6_9PEZI|nr:hypothetical protein Slin14017_G044440 [Septoria linicola]USW50772.1 hypothetical protein Slin15195_G040910 [Septoria linicola]
MFTQHNSRPASKVTSMQSVDMTLQRLSGNTSPHTSTPFGANLQPPARTESTMVNHIFGNTYILEYILLRLKPKDIASCMRINKLTKDVVENSSQLRDHVFGPYPARHNTVWTRYSADYIESSSGCVTLREAAQQKLQLDKQISYIIPVALNEALLPPPGTLHRSIYKSFKEAFPLDDPTNEAALSKWTFSHMAITRTRVPFKIDPQDSSIRDVLLTKPAVTDIRIRISNPDGFYPYKERPMVLKWSHYGDSQSIYIRKRAGIRVGDVVAAVAELGTDWLEQLSRPEQVKLDIRDNMAALVRQEMIDFVQRKGALWKHQGIIECENGADPLEAVAGKILPNRAPSLLAEYEERKNSGLYVTQEPLSFADLLAGSP